MESDGYQSNSSPSFGYDYSLDDTKAKMKERLSCQLCFQTLNDARSLPCTHAFCMHCLKVLCTNLQRSNPAVKLGSFSCPTCRTLIGVPLGGVECFPRAQLVDQVRNEAVDEIMRKIKRSLNEKSGSKRSSVVDSDGADYIDVDIMEPSGNNDSFLNSSSARYFSGQSGNFYPGSGSVSGTNRLSSRFNRNRTSYSSMRDVRTSGAGLSRSSTFNGTPLGERKTDGAAPPASTMDDNCDLVTPIIGRNRTGYSSLRDRRRRTITGDNRESGLNFKTPERNDLYDSISERRGREIYSSENSSYSDDTCSEKETVSDTRKDLGADNLRMSSSLKSNGLDSNQINLDERVEQSDESDIMKKFRVTLNKKQRRTILDSDLFTDPNKDNSTDQFLCSDQDNRPHVDSYQRTNASEPVFDRRHVFRTGSLREAGAKTYRDFVNNGTKFNHNLTQMNSGIPELRSDKSSMSSPLKPKMSASTFISKSGVNDSEVKCFKESKLPLYSQTALSKTEYGNPTQPKDIGSVKSDSASPKADLSRDKVHSDCILDGDDDKEGCNTTLASRCDEVSYIKCTDYTNVIHLTNGSCAPGVTIRKSKTKARTSSDTITSNNSDIYEQISAMEHLENLKSEMNSSSVKECNLTLSAENCSKTVHDDDYIVENDELLDNIAYPNSLHNSSNSLYNNSVVTSFDEQLQLIATGSLLKPFQEVDVSSAKTDGKRSQLQYDDIIENIFEDCFTGNDDTVPFADDSCLLYSESQATCKVSHQHDDCRDSKMSLNSEQHSPSTFNHSPCDELHEKTSAPDSASTSSEPSSRTAEPPISNLEWPTGNATATRNTDSDTSFKSSVLETDTKTPSRKTMKRNRQQTEEQPNEGSATLESVSTQEYAMPTAVAMLSNGVSVVADYGLGSLQYIYQDGSPPHTINTLKPFSVAVNNSNNNIIVGDRKNKTVCIFDDYGSDIAQWDSNLFGWICGIAVLRNGNLAILDRSKSKIGVYTPGGQLINDFGSYGSLDSQLCMGEFLAVDSMDRIITCDSGNHYIKVFSTDGKLIGKFGEGRGEENDGELQWPKGVCVDSRDNIIVADTCNNRVSSFSKSGEFVQHLVINIPSPYALYYKDPDTISVTMSSARGRTQYRMYSLPVC